MRLMTAVVLLSFSFAGEGRPSPSGDTSTVLADQYSSTNGTQGSSHVICRPTTWYDVCLFYFTNYIIHALSVRSLPGENIFSSTSFRFICLLIPFTGVRRGLSLVLRASNLAPNDLQAAARARALCMIVRSKDWRPQSGDVIDGCSVEPGETDVAGERDAERMDEIQFCHSSSTERDVPMAAIEKSGACATLSRRNNLKAIIRVKSPYNAIPDPTVAAKLAKYTVQTIHPQVNIQESIIADGTIMKIHGLCKLAPHYELCYVPSDMKVYPHLTLHDTTSSRPTDRDQVPLSQQTRLASSHAIPRIFFSLAQTISGVYQLYKVRGAQIRQYGFAAYGLTVIPYVIVSIINVLGSLLSNEYTSIYIVHSEIMDEMIGRGGMVDGIVGTIAVPKENFEEADRIQGESQCKVEGTSFVFEGSQDALRCRTIGDSPTQEFAIVEPEPANPIPKAPLKVRFRKSIHRLFHRTKGSRAPPTAASPMTITIHSHLSFTRLPRPRFQGLLDIIAIALLCIAIFTPYLIIGVLTGFRANNATTTQTNYALLWLVAGQMHGYFGHSDRLISRKRAIGGLLFIIWAYGSYCVGGFVIIAQELVESGMCTATTLWNPE